MSNDTLERLRKVTPLGTHREFASVRLELLQAARAEIETLELSWSNCSRTCAKLQSKLEAVQKYCEDGGYDDRKVYDGHSQACAEILALLA